MRITTKRDERESGLRRLWNSERGWDIKVDGKKIGRIGFARAYGDRAGRGGWYYSIHASALGIAPINTSGILVDDCEAVRVAAVTYVKKMLALAKADPSGSAGGR